MFPSATVQGKKEKERKDMCRMDMGNLATEHSTPPSPISWKGKCLAILHISAMRCLLSTTGWWRSMRGREEEEVVITISLCIKTAYCGCRVADRIIRRKKIECWVCLPRILLVLCWSTYFKVPVTYQAMWWVSSPRTSMVNLSCIVSHHTPDPWVALWQSVINVTLCCVG